MFYRYRGRRGMYNMDKAHALLRACIVIISIATLISLRVVRLLPCFILRAVSYSKFRATSFDVVQAVTVEHMPSFNDMHITSSFQFSQVDRPSSHVVNENT